MFTIPKARLIANLIKLQHDLCSYGTTHGDGRTCDCKFNPDIHNKWKLENTGCPELRQVLESMGVPYNRAKLEGKR